MEKGLDSTSINEIINRSGVAKGTFYYYFREKEELISHIRQRYLKRIVRIAADEMDKHGANDCPDRLNAWIHVLVMALLEPNTLYYDLLYSRPSRHRPSLSAEPVVQQLADLLDKGSNEAIWTVDESIPTAIFMVHALHGLVDNARTMRTPATELVSFSYRLFLKILNLDDLCKSQFNCLDSVRS